MFECLRRNKSYVLGMLLFIGFVCWSFYARIRDEKEMYRYVCETAVVSSFYTVEDNGKSGMTINIPDVNVKFRISPMNWGYRDIEKWSKEKYRIWKNADSDTLYFEKGSHKLYVLIVKPRKHWYYISDRYDF